MPDPETDTGLLTNRGLIEGTRDQDWAAGTIAYRVVVTDGNWEPYLSPGKKQVTQGLEPMNCTVHAVISCIQAQEFKLSGAMREYDERATAVMAGNTMDGNYVWKSVDSVRNNGLLAAGLWPLPNKFPLEWNDYYTAVPLNFVNLMTHWKDRRLVQYETIDPSVESLKYHLKQAPVVVTIPGHAINAFLVTNIKKYQDSYEPYLKQYGPNYLSATKVVLTIKNSMINEGDTVRGEGETDVFKIRSGKKDQYINGEAFEVLNGKWAEVKTVNAQELAAFPSGKVYIVVSQE